MLIRHSHTEMYLAIMSPKPAQSIRMGALDMISVSSIMPRGVALYRVVFTLSTTMEEEFEAKPSMEGAVPIIIWGRPETSASSLQVSLITPPPTPIMQSQDTSNAIAALPTEYSSGSHLE